MLSTLVVCCFLSVDPIATQFDFPTKPLTDYESKQDQYQYNDVFLGYHLGEDWNGKGGGSTDKGDLVYCIAAGRVVKVDNTEKKNSWGKIIVIAHTLPDLQIVYSVYAHLQKVLVSKGEVVGLGQKIGKIGDANRFYQGQAHLHFALMKRGPFPPKARGYEQELSWDTIDDYYIPTLFISNRRSPMTVKLSSGGWKEFTVPGQTPVSTAYVEVTPLFGDKQYYSLTEALTNGTLQSVIKRIGYNGDWEKLPAKQLDDFIFDPTVSKYALRSKLSSVAYTVKLVIFPLTADEEIMVLRSKSDILLVGAQNRQIFVRPQVETFWSTTVLLPFSEEVDFWLSSMNLLPQTSYHGPTALYQLTYYYSRPLLHRSVTTAEFDPSIVLGISPNKVD